MRIIARLTSKGQITVPKAIRLALHLADGDLVSFEVDGDAVRLRRIETAAPPARADGTPTALTEWSSAADEDAYRDL